VASRDVVEFSNAALSVLGGLIEFPGESGCLSFARKPGIIRVPRDVQDDG
jgi:hypothetical protein